MLVSSMRVVAREQYTPGDLPVTRLPPIMTSAALPAAVLPAAAAIVTIVNGGHLALCSSPEWARFVEDELLPWVLDGHDLGDALLEVGPGPGLTTDVLRRQAARL